MRKLTQSELGDILVENNDNLDAAAKLINGNVLIAHNGGWVVAPIELVYGALREYGKTMSIEEHLQIGWWSSRVKMKAYIVNIADGRVYDNEVASVVIATNRDDAIRLTRERLSRRGLKEEALRIDEVELTVGLVFIANGYDSTSIDIEDYG